MNRYYLQLSVITYHFLIMGHICFLQTVSDVFMEKCYFHSSTNRIIYCYSKSAHDADIFSNADAIGIYYAYQALTNNTGLKLSDVFTLYYKGSSALDPNLTVNPPSIGFYTVTNRWLLFALHFRFIEHVSGNQYNWLADQQHATRWNERKSLPPPLGEDYNYRLYRFAEFWYNVKLGATPTVPALKNGEAWIETGTRLKLNINFGKIFRFINNLYPTTEFPLVAQFRDTVFETIFLPTIKNRIISVNQQIVFI